MVQHKFFLRETNWVDGGKSRRRRTKLEKKAVKTKNRRQGSSAKSFIWEKILKDEKGEAERMGKCKGETKRVVEKKRRSKNK